MVHAEPVSSDLLPLSRQLAGCRCPPCFACRPQDRGKPSFATHLDEQQIVSRVVADTGTILNPFCSLNVSQKATVLLCTACRDKEIGWQVLCNPGRYGAKSAATALRLWRNRIWPDALRSSELRCFRCYKTNHERCDRGAEVGSRANRKQNPTRNWTLFNLRSVIDVLRSAFIEELKDYLDVTKELLMNFLPILQPIICAMPT